jgi:trehalose 6-phosphate phosphatase
MDFADNRSFRMYRTGSPIDEFVGTLESATTSALLLDYDGTLAPFVEDRTAAAPYPSVLPILRDLVDCEGTRVIIVSGRTTAEIASLLGLDQLPEIWGAHGLERLLPDGTFTAGKLDRRTARAIHDAAEWASSQGLGNRLERKPGGIALHWRGMDPRTAEDISQRAFSALLPLTRINRLSLGEFDGGIELRVKSCNKGHVVEQIAREMNDAPIAYLGDDRTDEDAFRAMQGRGLSVLVRPELRPTSAEVWLRPPDELVDFLRSWLQACGGAR